MMKESNILIVEDDNNLGDTLSEYLSSSGHLCSLAKTASEARVLFHEKNPDIVLMDITLPDGNGLELAREFRKTRKDFFLLFLSALNDPDTKVEGFEIGQASGVCTQNIYHFTEASIKSAKAYLSNAGINVRN